MRAITKNAEPPSLTEHRKVPHADYDNYADMDRLREALVSEQRGICCYCMNRIRNDHGTMKIEHWQPRSRYPDQQLTYRNMLGACMGGEGRPRRLQHCDTRKGDQDMQWNPAEPEHHIETRVRYEADGSIRADDGDFDAQFDDVLNLNINFLKNNRRAVWIGIIEWWKMEQARLHGPVPRARVLAERNRRVADNGQLEPFGQIAVWWLDQRLASTAP